MYRKKQIKGSASFPFNTTPRVYITAELCDGPETSGGNQEVH